MDYRWISTDRRGYLCSIRGYRRSIHVLSMAYMDSFLFVLRLYKQNNNSIVKKIPPIINATPRISDGLFVILFGEV